MEIIIAFVATGLILIYGFNYASHGESASGKSLSWILKKIRKYLFKLFKK